MTTTLIPDLTPGADVRLELQRAIAAAVKSKQTLELPGDSSVEWLLGDTLVLDAAVPIVGHGAWLKRMPNLPIGLNGQGRHVVVWQNSSATATVRSIGIDGSAIEQSAGFVGDNWRAQHVAGVDFADVLSRNMRGLTTSSTATLPETFSGQLLHVNSALLVRCHAYNDDGAPTATGLVFHWSNGIIRDTVVSHHSGQGIGSFGDSTVTVDHCASYYNHHGMNFEAGSTSPGGKISVLGNDHKSHIVGCTYGLLVNGNYGNALRGVAADDLLISQCRVPVGLAGMPSSVSVRRALIDVPGLAVVQALVPTLQAARNAAAKMQLIATVKDGAQVPVFSWAGKPQSYPKTWDITEV